MTRELAHRYSGPLDVALYWDPDGVEIIVELIDYAACSSFRLVVPPEHALDAFHHPYAYAPDSLDNGDEWVPDGLSYGIRVD